MTKAEIEAIKTAIQRIKAGVVPSTEALKILYGLIGDTDSLSEIKKKDDEYKRKEAARRQRWEIRDKTYKDQGERWENSPKWFKEYFGGVSNHKEYSIFAETKNWAIVKKPGSTCYLNRMSGSKYFPTQYCLVSKVNTPHLGSAAGEKTLFSGRLGKADKEKLIVALVDADSDKTVFFDLSGT